MSRPHKRRRANLQGFHTDSIEVEAEDSNHVVHAREGGVQKRGNYKRLTVDPPGAESTVATDTFLQASFWPTPDDPEYALDANGDLFDQALFADVMEEPSALSHPSKKGKKRSKVSRRPHVVWKEQYRQTFLDEILWWSGRGDFRPTASCPDCIARSSVPANLAQYRCCECFVPDLTCSSCCVRRHRGNPFHRIQKWDGEKFTKVSLKSVGLTLQLGHSGLTCHNPIPAHSSLLILHTNGIHEVAISYCGCSRALPHNIQLLRRRLYPASHITIKTCATFELLNHLHKFALTTKASTYDFYRALEKLTNNTGMNVPKSRYRPLFRMILQWRHLKMLQWAGRGHDAAGADATKTGELAVRCPSCPHPGINLPENWEHVSPNLKFLFMMIICLDANFRLKNQLVSNYSQDPGLGIGWAFLVPRLPYEAYVLSRANDEDISTCVGFQALAKANTKFSVGLRYTGVGAAVCGRSEMIFPSGVGNLQKGERYANMDYIFGSVLQFIYVCLVLVSYDISCQWFANLFTRMDNHWPDSIKPRLPHTVFTPAIPKLHEPMHEQKNHEVYSLNLIHGVGLSDCECPERVWAPHNPLSNSTKTQGPGSRQDVLDDHFNFWNWLKYIGMGPTLLRRYKAAVAQRNLQQEGHRGLTASTDAGLVSTWEAMCQNWEADGFPKKMKNPYYLPDAYLSEAQVRKELAEEEKRRIKAGGISYHETSAATFIQMGLDLEETQRRLKRLDAAVALKSNPALADGKNMTEERNTFRVRLRAWEKLLPIYMPGLLQYQTNLGRAAKSPDNSPASAVTADKTEDAALWLPSCIPAHLRPSVCLDGLPDIEERMREAQCTDSLQKLRRILRVKSRMIHFKNKNLRGQRDGTRSRTVIDRIHLKARNAADRYRAARAARLSLTGPGSWEEKFQVLHNEDIRGYQDPDRLRSKVGRAGTLEDSQSQQPDVPDFGDNDQFELFNDIRTRRDGTGETRRTISWIWWTTPAADDQEDIDIVRVEWAKSRARAARAREEVMLLKEEMRRVLAFLEWKCTWWKGHQDSRTNVTPDLAEGLQAFALCQSNLQQDLASHFRHLWKAPLEDIDQAATDISLPADQGASETAVEEGTTDVNGLNRDDVGDEDEDDDDEGLEDTEDNSWEEDLCDDED